MLRKKIGKKGFSLLEVVMSMSIVTISFWGAIAGLQFLWKGISSRRVATFEASIVATAVDRVRSNAAQYAMLASHPDETSGGVPIAPAEFPVPNATTGEFTQADLDKFQYAYSSNGTYFGRSTDCPACDGRLMFVLQPYGSEMPGAVKITIRSVKLKGLKMLRTKEYTSFVNSN